jgi:ABC-type transport system involved in multi-copper enzyme maturation permease subunit
MVTHEFRRWLGQMTVPFLLALPTLVGIASMLVRREGVLGDQEEIMAGDLASATDVNAFEGVARSLHSGLWLLSYVVLGLASLSVAGEFAQGTLRNVLLRPLRRLQIAFGKWLALLGASLFSYVLLAGTSVAVAAWAFDFTGVFEILPNGKRFELVKAEEIWPDFKRVLVSPLLPLVAYAGIGFLAGSVVRRGAAALSFALGLGIFLDLGRDFARGSALEAWFPPVYMPSLGRSSFVDYFLEVSQGISNATFQFGDTDVLVPVVWALAAFALAALALKRRYVP